MLLLFSAYFLLLTFNGGDLDSCLSYARENSPLLQEARWDVRLAEYDSRTDSWFFRCIPKVSFSVGSGFRPLEVEGNTIWIAGEKPWQTVTSGVHLTWTLDRILGSGLSEDRINRIKLTQAKYRLANIHREITAKVTEAYSHYTALKNMQKALKTEVEACKDKVKIQEIYYERGRTTQDKLLDARVQLEEAKIRLYETEHQSVIARLQLEQLIGLE